MISRGALRSSRWIWTRETSPAEVKHLQVSDKEITAVADIADTLAESFSEISSNKHYSSKFQSHKAHAERQTLKFNSQYGNIQHSILYRRTTRCTFQF